MQESIKFSLVICTFNDGIYVENALQSVFKQTYTTWELIIIDDGSSDDTQDRLKKYRNHPSLILIRNDENKGKSSCLNQALERVSGTWLIELDADDWLEENCLKRLSQDVINDHDTAMIYGWYLEWVERHRDKKLFRGRLVKNELSNNFTRYIENPVPLAPRVHHTDTLRREGGWDTKDIFQGRYFEDVYMICVLLKAEYKIRIIKETLYHRRLRKGSISDNKTEKYLIWKESMFKKMGIKKE